MMRKIINLEFFNIFRMRRVTMVWLSTSMVQWEHPLVILDNHERVNLETQLKSVVSIIICLSLVDLVFE